MLPSVSLWIQHTRICLKSGSAVRNLRWIDVSVLEKEEDIKLASEWLRKFNTSHIDRKVVSYTFSRSSGPGGQNVNKTNTKATLRININEASFLPTFIKNEIIANTKLVTKENEIVISSDQFRSQMMNVQECQNKLHRLILQISSNIIPGMTSDAQRDHVKRLIEVDHRKKRMEKVKHSSKKEGRRKVNRDD